MTERRAEGSELRHVRVGSMAAEVSVRERDVAAPPLLMLNGIGAEHTLWGRTRELVDRTTVAFDVRAEHLGGRRPSVRTFASFVAGVLTELGIPRADVLGFSWGGTAAQQLAHDHPTLVRRLVLVSTSPGFIGVPTRPSSTRTIMSPHRDPERMPELIRNLYSGDFVADPGLAHELGLIRPVDQATYRRQFWALLGWTSVPWLPLLHTRTLILHAENDPVFPYVNAVLMSRLIRRATLRRVEGGGHLFVLTRPEVSAGHINEFLD